jgi:hypothetical protein
MQAHTSIGRDRVPYAPSRGRLPAIDFFGAATLLQAPSASTMSTDSHDDEYCEQRDPATLAA